MTASRRVDPAPAVERPSAERPAAVTSLDATPVTHAPAPKEPHESVSPPAPTAMGSSTALRPAPETVKTPDGARPPKDFREKLRNDWHAIRRGWDSAGDDFRHAIDRLRTGGQ